MTKSARAQNILNRLHVSTLEARFSEPSGQKKNWFEKAGISKNLGQNYREVLSKRNENWLENMRNRELRDTMCLRNPYSTVLLITEKNYLLPFTVIYGKLLENECGLMRS